MVTDVLNNRGQYAAFVTILLAMIVLTISSVLVLQYESNSPDANIKTGWDAFWYSVVTITTVGYGDRYPITFAGRVTGMFIMFSGVGIIGALASILSSVLVGGASAPAEEEVPESMSSTANEQTIADLNQKLTRIESELTALHKLLDNKTGEK